MPPRNATLVAHQQPVHNGQDGTSRLGQRQIDAIIAEMPCPLNTGSNIDIHEVLLHPRRVSGLAAMSPAKVKGLVKKREGASRRKSRIKLLIWTIGEPTEEPLRLSFQ